MTHRKCEFPSLDQRSQNNMSVQSAKLVLRRKHTNTHTHAPEEENKETRKLGLKTDETREKSLGSWILSTASRYPEEKQRRGTTQKQKDTA